MFGVILNVLLAPAETDTWPLGEILPPLPAVEVILYDWVHGIWIFEFEDTQLFPSFDSETIFDESV